MKPINSFQHYDAQEENLVIFFHGYGGGITSFDPIRSRWWPCLPGVEFVAARGAYPLSNCSGFSWVENTGYTYEKKMINARKYFDSVIEEIILSHDMVDHLDRIALVGFSQGANMILDALISGRWPVGIVVTYSGRIMNFHAEVAKLDSQVLLIHGEQDNIVKPAELENAALVLSDAGAKVEAFIVQGLAHGINEEATNIGGEFIINYFR